MSAEIWLRSCIYERLPFKNKSLNQLLTFMVSSFWHGFYGGYYLSFFFWFSQTHLQNLVFKISKNPDNMYVKAYKQTKTLGRILLWIGANALFTVNGVYFQVLSLRQGLKIMSSMYYIPTIALFGLIIVFTYLPGGKGKKKPVKNE